MEEAPVIGIAGCDGGGMEQLQVLARIAGLGRFVILAEEHEIVQKSWQSEDGAELVTVEGMEALCHAVDAAVIFPGSFGAEGGSESQAWSHWARRILDRGSHLLLGIPPAQDMDGLQAVLERGKTGDGTCHLAQLERFSAAYTALFQLFAGGVGGTYGGTDGLSSPRYVEILRLGMPAVAAGGGHEPADAPGWWWHLGLGSDLDLLRLLPGASDLTPVDEGLTLMFPDEPGPCRVRLEAGPAAPETAEHRWRLMTPAQVIEVDFLAPAVTLYPAARGGRIVPRRPFTRSERQEARAVEALFDGKGKADWSRVQRVMAASIRADRAIPLALPEAAPHRRAGHRFLAAWLAPGLAEAIPAPGPTAAPRVPACTATDGLAVLKLLRRLAPGAVNVPPQVASDG